MDVQKKPSEDVTPLRIDHGPEPHHDVLVAKLYEVPPRELVGPFVYFNRHNLPLLAYDLPS